MPNTSRFWGLFSLIALAHVLAMIALIQRSHQSKFTEVQSVVWMNSGGAGDGENADPVSKPSESTPVRAQLKKEDLEEDRPILTSAKSEIDLTRATAKPTATPKARPTSKPIPKATPKPKKKVLAEVPDKARPKLTQREKNEVKFGPEKKTTLKKNEVIDDKPRNSVAIHGGLGKGVSTGTSGKTVGASATSQFGWYGNMLHDRFHSAWIQPTTVAQSGEKISVLVRVRIEQDGSVSQFQVVKPSGNVVIDESVSAVAQRVTQVDPLPSGLATAGHYDVRINFELKPE